MIYAIKYDGRTIASSIGDSTQMIYGGQLQLAANDAGSLRFVLPVGHVSYDVPTVHKGIISVERDGAEIFFGRIVDMTEDRQRSRAFECEGGLSYFSDVTLRESSYQKTMAQIAAYMTQQTGMSFEADDTTLVLSGRANTGSTVKDALSAHIAKLGGYIYLHRYDGVIHIAYSPGPVGTSTQVIRDGDNLADIKVETDGTEVYTRIIGTYDSGEDEVMGVYSKNTELYGIREKRVKYDNVSTVLELQAAVQAELEQTAEPQKIVTAAAVDKSLSDRTVEPIQLLTQVRTIAQRHGVDDYLLAAGLNIDLTGMTPTRVTMGQKTKTLTQIVSR